MIVGVDAVSTHCYLIESVEHRDEDTWGYHLLDVMAQGFDLEYTIANGSSGLRAGQKAIIPKVPCHGDVFHIQEQFEQVANVLFQQISKTSLKDIIEQWLFIQQFQSQRQEQALLALNEDVKTLLCWFSHDVLALAGTPLAVRQELFDFIVSELKQREDKRYSAIRKLRKALRNQLLAFVSVLDQKLADVARCFKLPLQAAWEVCLLHRKHKASNTYWKQWNQLHSQLSHKFYEVMKADCVALEQTPRASSMVENLNSRLRNYFFRGFNERRN